MKSVSEEIERKLRNVEYCNMRVPGDDTYTISNYSIALRAARLIKRQRKEIKDLMDEKDGWQKEKRNRN